MFITLSDPIQLPIFLISISFIVFILASIYNFSVRYIVTLNSIPLLIAIILLISNIYIKQTSYNEIFFVSSILSIVIYSCVLCTIVFLPFQLKTTKHLNELSFLFVLSAALMNILLYSSNYVYAYLLIEAIAFSFYIFISYYSRTLTAVESTIKYYFVGNFVAIIFLLGIFFFYRSTLTISFDKFYLIQIASENHLFLTIGCILILTALSFKLGAAPLHFWVPEVYQGTPFYAMPIVVALGKLTIGYFLFYFLSEINKYFNFVINYAKILFYFLAISSMIIGNLLAIKQKEVKRVLAYSSIANVGYLLSLLTIEPSDYVISVYFSYLLIYSLSVFFFFFVLSFVVKDKRKIYLTFEDFSYNLANSNIFLIISLFLILLNLAGFPPTVAFLLKLSIIYHLVSHNQVLLALIFLLSTILSVYYYWVLISCVIKSIKRVSVTFYLPIQEILFTLVVLFVSFYFLIGILIPNVIPFFK